MIKIFLITIISIFLDGILSLYIGYLPNNLSIFLCNFTLMSLLYTSLHMNRKWFLIYLFLISILYDILYTDIFMYTSLIYFTMYLIMDKIKFKFIWSYYIFYIFLYNTLNYLLYGLIYEYISIIYLLKICYSSLIMSTLYISIISLTDKKKKIMINVKERNIKNYKNS